MEYRSKYKAEEIETILDAKNNTGEGVDSNLDVLFTGQLQTKEVEVSEDTTIKADEGFLGLKEVSVKVSGGGSGTASSVEYWDVSANSGVLSEIALFFLLLKSTSDYGTDILSIYNLTTKNITILAIALDRSMPLCIEGTLMSCGEWLDAMQLADFAQFGWTRITESEFYAL